MRWLAALLCLFPAAALADSAEVPARWVRLPLDAGIRPLAVAAAAGRVVVVGDGAEGGEIRISTDQGATWQASATDVGLVGVWLAPDGTAYVLGSGSTIFSSRDGRSWTRLAGGMATAMSAISGTAREVVVVGLAGTVLRSDDQGQLWPVARRGDEAEILSAVYGAGKRVLVGGDNGRLLVSDDGGKKFRILPSAMHAQVSGVWFGGNEVWAAGGSEVVRSGDGGKTFARVQPPGATEVHAVWGSGPKDVYVGAGAGQLLHSTDGGKSFAPELVRGGPAIVAIAGSSARDVYAVWAGKALWRHLEDPSDCADFAPLPALARCKLVQPRTRGVVGGSFCVPRTEQVVLTAGPPLTGRTAPALRTVIGDHTRLRYQCQAGVSTEAALAHARKGLVSGGMTLPYDGRDHVTAQKETSWAQVTPLPDGYAVDLVRQAPWSLVPDPTALAAALEQGPVLLWGASGQFAGDLTAREALESLYQVLKAHPSWKVTLRARAGGVASRPAAAGARAYLSGRRIDSERVVLGEGAPSVPSGAEAANVIEATKR